MKYTIKSYQVLYDNGARDKVTLDTPLHTDNIEAVRIKLKMKHTGHGITCIGLNLDYVEHNINDR